MTLLVLVPSLSVILGQFALLILSSCCQRKVCRHVDRDLRNCCCCCDYVDDDSYTSSWSLLCDWCKRKCARNKEKSDQNSKPPAQIYKPVPTKGKTSYMCVCFVIFAVVFSIFYKLHCCACGRFCVTCGVWPVYDCIAASFFLAAVVSL